MNRLMGLDVGERTIGVALSDPLMITAQGLKTIKREGYKKDFEELKKIIEEYNVNKIIIGLPLRLNGTQGIQCEKILEFTNKLKEIINISIDFQDERLTTSASERILLEANVKRKKRKKVIDKLAAVQILITYMEKSRCLNGK